MKILPNDICRCHDETCRDRERCLRWICREQVGDYVTHCNTMSSMEADTGKCSYFMEEKKK